MIFAKIYLRYGPAYSGDPGYRSCWTYILKNDVVLANLRDDLGADMYAIDFIDLCPGRVEGWVLRQLAHEKDFSFHFLFSEDMAVEEYNAKLLALNPTTEQPIPKRRLELDL